MPAYMPTAADVMALARAEDETAGWRADVAETLAAIAARPPVVVGRR